MSELASSPPPRRLRADAQRSITAILDAATRVLGQRPDASMEDIAKAAGISRQTVYAHFPSRDALLGVLFDRVTEQVLAAIDAADLDSGPADQALVRFLEIGWQAFDADPFLLHLAEPPLTPQQERARHEPLLYRLEQLVRRGQRSGAFDPDLPVAWILSATLALGHTAGEEVRAGRMTSAQAIDVLRRGIPRLFRAENSLTP
ncbi:TetR/AcrR family transcriptional regulator [Actinocrinis puniceicyclus]|uniref:TetR/AcrR family transcriptional regulator n=1 Tax=Actinocrinis puniceicyclus TaxID=977794 RepID=A0A8J7WPY3_9ACTN|nr:TetR/AcrR family transcriptional regulator [Actinocrinis puniceicyclus]MBS2966358.1 TetR/AcrR family transcriptional regulator [Actinocrinis puniceicyclus]